MRSSSKAWNQFAEDAQFNAFGWLYAILGVEVLVLVLLNQAGRTHAADHYFYIAIYAVAAVYAFRAGARLLGVTAVSVGILRLLVALGNEGLPLQVASLLFANLFVLTTVIYAHGTKHDRRLGVTHDRGETSDGEGQDDQEEGSRGDSGG